MTILTRNPRFLAHNTGRHPESSSRLQSIEDILSDTQLMERCLPGEMRLASFEDIALVHQKEVWNKLQAMTDAGGGRLDGETIVSADSFSVARAAAGSVIASVDAICAAKDKNALCLVRPPGHHATASQSMGFCLFNNVAIAAQYALSVKGIHRVLIVDWDVHHGNGTQDIFYESDAVHFLSMHRFPFYPGSGDTDEVGQGRGRGATYNLPIAYGTSSQSIREIWRRGVEAAARHCKPDLILISAGFDGHKDDPIGDLGLSAEDFGCFTQAVMEVADVYCQGRIVSVLEGGYGLPALGESVAAHLAKLLS